MSNFISWALAHQNNWRKKDCEYDITVQAVEGNFAIRGSKVDPGETVNNQGIRVQASHVLFMIDTQHVTFQLRRGVKFIVDGETYEIIIDRSLGLGFDDPEKRTMIIPAKICDLPN